MKIEAFAILAKVNSRIRERYNHNAFFQPNSFNQHFGVRVQRVSPKKYNVFRNADGQPYSHSLIFVLCFAKEPFEGCSMFGVSDRMIDSAFNLGKVVMC